MRRLLVAIAAPALMHVASPARAQGPAYRNAALPIETRVQDVLGRMTLEEKFWQLFMIPGGREDPRHDYGRGVFGLQNRTTSSAAEDARLHNALQRYFVDSTRLGIPIIPFEEAVHGLMRRGAMVYPAAIGLAATFDTAVMRDVAGSIAMEARARGVRQVLSPVVNLADDVRWGRVEETYGEDPHLAGVMGRVFVREFERRGIVATPKHFVANVGAGGRDSYPIEASERVLHELHFPPFREALDAGARSVMTSYNSVNGMPATQSAFLLTETLRRHWRFPGFVISDQAAVGGAVVLHHTEASTATATKRALDAGLDVIFQSSFEQHAPYLNAFRNGTIAPRVIDSAVARVLRAKFQLGLFERPYVSIDSAARWDSSREPAGLARRAAAASMVLLRNERGALPFSSTLRRIAVLGPDAAEARLGGYTLDDARGVSVLAGLRERFGDGVRHARGAVRMDTQVSVVPAEALDSLRGEYFANPTLTQPSVSSRADQRIDFRWTFNAPMRGVPVDWYSVRWTGTLRAPPGGVRSLGVEGNDGYRLWLDGKLLIDNWRKQSYRTTVVPASLAPGSVHAIRLEYFETTGNARVRLVWDAGAPIDAEAVMDSALSVARDADAVVIVAGIEEGEFRDRASLALPGRQEELILRAAALGKPVVVVLVGGSAVTMSRWIDRVDAVLVAWYPGAEGGRAVVDVLSGAVNPAGRLPITFPIAEGQLPLTYNHKPTGRGDDYVDLTGHPAFPFGFGLSYATFAYSDLRIEPARIRGADSVAIRFRVRNTGARAGAEVPQLYVRDVLASVSRPVLELKGFARIELAPGEERDVTLMLRGRDLRFLDERMNWVVEPGLTRILVGASSRDIRLRGDLEIVP